MPVTLSYDVTNIDNNDRTYIRSMLERFHFKRLGGSVFRYSGIVDANGNTQEDWLNHVVPALMFFRSFVVAHNITLKFFTVDASSISMLDHSDPGSPYGAAPTNGAALSLNTPSNVQSSEQTIRGFIDAASGAV